MGKKEIEGEKGGVRYHFKNDRAWRSSYGLKV
jgi:hypothetical protein